MQTHPFDKLPLKNGGAFLFTPCPGVKDASLQDAVAQLKAAGTKAIVTLMYDKEMVTNAAQELPEVCSELNVDWCQLPISDEDAPSDDFVNALKAHLGEILAILNGQGTVAVHCKGGSGRTGLAIGLLMAQLGYDKTEIIEQVQSLRPKALKHPVQRAYFDGFDLV